MEHKIYYYMDRIEIIRNGKYVPPITCEIDSSCACQLSCRFCIDAPYLKTNGKHLDWLIYLNLIVNLALQRVKSITFTGGGEPLMHPRFNDMVDVALAAGLEIGLITNGINLHKVRNLNRLKFIRVSLDASNARMYKKVKGVAFFDQVISNIRLAIEQNQTVGISYVVCEENCWDLDKVAALAKELGAAYIQFKPAILNGSLFTNYVAPDGHQVIKTGRYRGNGMACTIAHLVGVVGATGDVYYCCQHRGQEDFKLGNLNDEPFSEIWLRRIDMKPNIKNCHYCRYMSYAREYEALLARSTLFFEHRSFL